MTTFVMNGWAAGPEAWALTTFSRDWTFDYVEEMDGLPAKIAREIEGPLFLVGFSMGGLFALKLLLENRARVKGLVLVSATPRMMEERPSWRGMSARRIEALKKGTELVFERDPSPVYKEENLVRGLDILRRVDLRADLEAAAREKPFTLPVAILQSERDGIVRSENAAYLKTIFPTATVTLVKGGEHVLPITASELVSQTVEKVRAQALQRMEEER